MGRFSILLILAVAASAGCDSSVEYSTTGFWGDERGGLVQSPEWPDEQGPNSYFESPVSISRWRGTDYLLCNYKNIFECNLSQGTARVLNRPTEDIKYNPTGLCYSTERKSLFVANYQGQNVLELRIEGKQLSLVQSITSTHMIEPEGVSVSEDGTRLAVATYSGRSIHVFDLTRTPAVELWNRKFAREMHGVAIVGSRVYAPMLFDGKLFEIDLRTGDVLRSVGSPGLSTAQLQLLWPTSINTYGARKDLLIADAWRGSIFCVDRESLKPRMVFGANGPTDQHLFEPYCAIEADGDILVTSTGQDRIVRIRVDHQGRSVSAIQSLGRRAGEWDYLRNSPILSHCSPVGPEWDWPDCTTGPAIRFLDAAFGIGFKTLTRRDRWGGPPRSLQVCALTGLFAAEFQFTTLFRHQDAYLLVSSVGKTAIYFAKNAGVYYMIPVAVPRGTWVLDNQILAPHGPYGDGLMKSMKNVIASVEKRRYSNGLLPSEALRCLYTHPFTPRPAPDDAAMLLEQSILTKYGKRFLEQYLTLSSGSTQADVIAVADAYFTAFRKRGKDFVNMDELVLVSLLCHFDPDDPSDAAEPSISLP